MKEKPQNKPPPRIMHVPLKNGVTLFLAPNARLPESEKKHIRENLASRSGRLAPSEKESSAGSLRQRARDLVARLDALSGRKTKVAP